MPKRSASDALQAAVPAPKVEGAALKSRSGRVVRPKVWDDGTLAAPLAALKDDAGEGSPVPERGDPDAADPDFSLEKEQASEEGHASGGTAHGGAAVSSGHHAHSHPHGADSGEEGEVPYSDDSPRVSVGGSQGSVGRARSGSVGRDEHGKFTSGHRARGGRGGRAGGRGEGGGGGIFKQAAVEVLRLEKRLMSTGEIARVALKRGLIKCTGKTPEATMASALYTDIKRKEGQSVFIRPHEGLFGLREWVEQGVAFQDEFAEEMAKRARAAFGVYAGIPGMPPMMPPMVDSDGVPIGTPYGPAMMPFPGMPPMGMLPPDMLPPGMAAHHSTHAAAGAAKGAAKGSDDDGLMGLLAAAEELTKTTGEEGKPQAAAEGEQPAAAAAAAAQQEQAAAAAPEGEGAAPMDTDGERQQQHGEAGETAEQQLPAAQQQQDAQQLQQQHAQQQGASEAGTAADEDDAAAALAAVADAAAEEPAGARRGASEEPAEGRRFPGFPMPGEAGAMPYPYPYHMYHQAYGYYQPYMYGPPPAGVPGLPPLPKQRSGGAPGELQLLQSGGSGGLDLTVRGSNRAFTGAARGAGGAAAVAAAVAADGQEQVNILNLPLPEVELQGEVVAGGDSGVPAGSVAPGQLKEAEAQVMGLEKELGTSHPEVGKAYLSLSRLYLAGCAESNAKQLAVAALSRAAEIMNVCQLALKRQPSCSSSFTYLMDRIRSGEQRPLALAVPAAAAAAAAPATLAEQRPVGEPAAHGEDAHVALPGSAVEAH
ncbi:Tctex1 domain-containing 2 [Micractinium conductrix]|uniref:Tctex1 domain-containing 2 n=1 Tax=Micractinium conductrix TaxID=554055 RepID=A0A2P6VKV8_9CHLO|nr:Tctex1 domain-containing 2 [Micractinium conductrix]|eukprot:PSC74723.1 Tctex1 domain-containing 2 [Micractinium conductrix]